MTPDTTSTTACGMKPVRIPVALLTVDAVLGLTYVCFGSPKTHKPHENTTDGMVLDDWLKEQGVDVSTIEPSYASMRLSTDWFYRMTMTGGEVRAPHLNFQSMLQMLYPFLPEVPTE